YWNSGIFIFSIKIILDEFNRFYPEIFQDLENNLENKESLDKAIIEKTDRLVTILADFDWADVGSWKQIYRLEEKDENNNFLVNENKFEILEVSDSLLIGGYKQIALIGLRNIAVIDAYDVLAIFNLDDQNKIKTILKNLEDRHGQKFLLQKPFVSVVTTVFTYREEVKEAIRSVVDQDYPYIEHIIVDYGNNEEWYKELEDYIKTFDLGSKEIYIVREKQSWPGVYPAMNRGLREVTGEIIGILNADDIYYDQSVISTVVDSFLSEKWDMCWGDLIYVSRKDLTNITRFWRGENYSPGSYKKGWQAPHPTLFVRREVYEKFGYYREDIPIAADYEFMIRILEKHRLKGCYINKLLAKMREGGESNWKNILRVLKGNYSVYRSIKSLGLKFNPFYIFLKLLKKIIQVILK
ncbi:MAG: glycosyltransferase, partial [Candidatus Calescibacterium sp.]|nr:glycosyltransferase [Candidatus Calescibacterium sp.]